LWFQDNIIDNGHYHYEPLNPWQSESLVSSPAHPTGAHTTSSGNNFGHESVLHAQSPRGSDLSYHDREPLAASLHHDLEVLGSFEFDNNHDFDFTGHEEYNNDSDYDYDASPWRSESPTSIIFSDPNKHAGSREGSVEHDPTGASPLHDRDDAGWEDESANGSPSSRNTFLPSASWSSEDGLTHHHDANPTEPTRRVFHPSVNGTLSKLPYIFLTMYITLAGRICDKYGRDIPPETPPPPRESDHGPDDWTPYNSRIEFEIADFIFRSNQMSGGDIDVLLDLWAATLAPHDAEPPFRNHTDLYSTIDSTPLGDVEWESFTTKYNGDMSQEGETPPWMEAQYETWFRDPRQLVKNLLSNPDFKDEFDYSPFHEYDADDNHRFQDFMSGDWAWKQAVSSKSHSSIFLTLTVNAGSYYFRAS
jgi:hypothetical protein